MLKTLSRIGYEKPSPVQAGVIPLVLDEYDVIGQARTGTGKTAAFAIPILEQLDLKVKQPKPQALIFSFIRLEAVGGASLALAALAHTRAYSFLALPEFSTERWDSMVTPTNEACGKGTWRMACFMR